MTFIQFLHHNAVALLILLAALGVGGGILQLVRLQVRSATHLWLAMSCGLGLLSVATLLIGIAGLWYSALFLLLLTPLMLIGLLWIARSHSRQQVQQWLAWHNSDLSVRMTAYLLLTLSAGTILWALVTHALVPPYEWDEIIYHLTLPKLYVQAHRVMYVPYICLSLWPMNNEMLFGISLLLGSEIAHHLIMLGMVVLIILGLIVTARRYFDDRVGIVAAILFLNVPQVHQFAGTGLIDIPMGLYVLAAMLAFNRWQEERRWPWLVLSGVFCGFVAGSKLSGAGIPLLLGLLLLIDQLRQRPLQIGTVVRNVLLFGIAGLLIVGPWYARSFLATGNPIWPFAYELFGGQDWDALGNEYLVDAQMDLLSPNWPRTPTWLLTSFVYLLTEPSTLGHFPEGLGVVIPLGALGAALLVRGAPRFLWQSLFVSAGFYLLWFLLLPLQLRYLLPIMPLLALSTAYLFIWLYDRARFRPLQLGLIAVLLLLVIWQSPWTNVHQRNHFMSHLAVVRGDVSQEDWLDRQHKGFALFRYANTQLSDDSRILLLPYESRTYYLDRPYVWGCLTCQRIIPFEQFDSARELLPLLQAMGITHVIDNPQIKYDRLRYWEHDRTLMLELKDECGEPILEDGEAMLYKLTECATTVDSDSS